MRLPHTITKKKSLLIRSLDEMPLVGPTLPLRCLYTIPASTLLSTVSPSWGIDLQPRDAALSLWVSHLGFRLLKLNFLLDFRLSLSPSTLPLRGPASTSGSRLLDHPLPLSADDSPAEKISLFGSYPCPSTTKNVLNRIFLPRTSQFRKSIS